MAAACALSPRAASGAAVDGSGAGATVFMAAARGPPAYGPPALLPARRGCTPPAASPRDASGRLLPVPEPRSRGREEGEVGYRAGERASGGPNAPHELAALLGAAGERVRPAAISHGRGRGPAASNRAGVFPAWQRAPVRARACALSQTAKRRRPLRMDWFAFGG